MGPGAGKQGAEVGVGDEGHRQHREQPADHPARGLQQDQDQRHAQPGIGGRREETDGHDPVVFDHDPATGHQRNRDQQSIDGERGPGPAEAPPWREQKEGENQAQPDVGRALLDVGQRAESPGVQMEQGKREGDGRHHGRQTGGQAAQAAPLLLTRRLLLGAAAVAPSLAGRARRGGHRLSPPSLPAGPGGLARHGPGRSDTCRRRCAGGPCHTSGCSRRCRSRRSPGRSRRSCPGARPSP